MENKKELYRNIEGTHILEDDSNVVEFRNIRINKDILDELILNDLKQMRLEYGDKNLKDWDLLESDEIESLLNAYCNDGNADDTLLYLESLYDGDLDAFNERVNKCLNDIL